MTFGQKIDPILQELHNVFLEQVLTQEQQKFSDKAVVYASRVFMDVMMDKLYDRIIKDDIAQPIAEIMAGDMGKELRQFIQKWIKVDTRNFYQ